MPRTISVLNFKGGTAKTTTVVNLAMGLALRGHRVLAIDLDSQGSVAAWFGASYERTAADLLLRKAEWPECIVRCRPRMDIIPSNRKLAEAQRILTEQGERPDVLTRRLAGIETAGYDFIFLDCAPSIDLLSEAALHFSQEVFVQVSMEYLALIGARTVIVEVLRARRLAEGRSARISMIIPSFYDARFAKSQEILQLLQEHFPGLVAHPIRAAERLSEAPSHGMTIFEYDPAGPGSRDYARLVERIAGHATGPGTPFSATAAK